MQTIDFKESVLVNGESSVACTVRDRGLQYGHGLFETIAIKHGQAEHWDLHMARLVQGCTKLSIKAPDLLLLKNESAQLCSNVERAVLKIIYTAGEGGRGYRNPDPSSPTRILMLSAWPDYPQKNVSEGVTIRLCQTHLGSNRSLAGIKHLNRLEQLIARSEWSDPDIAEGLMLDLHGQLVEGTMSNIFFVKDQTLCTPAIEASGISGVMREVILDKAESLGIKIFIDTFTPEDIFQADELFLSNSLIGIWPVRHVGEDINILYTLPGTITTRLISELNQAESLSE